LVQLLPRTTQALISFQLVLLHELISFQLVLGPVPVKFEHLSFPRQQDCGVLCAVELQTVHFSLPPQKISDGLEAYLRLRLDALQ
jgi:hypothetical protein